MIMQSNTSRHQLLRDILTFAKNRMLKVANETNTTAIVGSTSSSPLNINDIDIILGVSSICIIISLFIKIFMQTIRNFESPSYNRFSFIVNEESESESESESTKNDGTSENTTSNVESLSPPPISPQSSLSSKGKYLHIQTPIKCKYITTTPQTPLPLRRSLRLKIKSELNLSTMENHVNYLLTTRSQSRQRKNQNITVSSDPCPMYKTRSSITTPSPHPEHDEERAYYIQYCNEKKMKNRRPEFNSPLFIRRLLL